MACVGYLVLGRLYTLAILVFGLTLGNQPSLEIEEFKISEIIDEFDPKEYLFESHNIVRRAAGSIQPSLSTVSSSVVLMNSSKPTSKVPTGILSSRLKQSALPGIRSSSIAFVRPSTASVFVPSIVIYTSSPNTPDPNTPDPNTPAITTPDLNTPAPNTPGPTTSDPTTSASKKPPTKSASNFQDHHKYYSSYYYGAGRQWWFDLDNGSNKPVFHSELSTNTKFSDLFKISFTFPYYGHLIDNVTITNKGYLFLGERPHKFNASAQYAAPLMANFYPVLNSKTSIRYIDTGDRLTVEWANMRLKNEAQDKEFSFQCSILKNGTLIFAYKKIPIPVDKLKTTGFFVRVGVSDTFRREKIRRGDFIIGGKKYTSVRYIYYYLYDKVELQKNKVTDGSAFVLVPVPNCVMFNSCDTCVNTQTKFDCSWCSKINRCSDGIDRHRMTWETAGCLEDSVKSCASDSSSISGGEIAVIVIVLVIVILIIAWFVYAYYHPQSKSGLCLMKYGNPMKWCRNRSETQSTSTDGGRISFKTMSFESNA